MTSVDRSCPGSPSKDRVSTGQNEEISTDVDFAKSGVLWGSLKSKRLPYYAMNILNRFYNSWRYRRYADALELTSKFENADRNILREYQVQLLEQLCRHARVNVPFYRERLSCLFDLHDNFSPENWEQVPVLTRRDVQQNQKALTSKHVPARHGKISTARTSGSSGEPVKVLRTQKELVASRSMFNRFDRWHEFDPAGKLALVLSAPMSGKTGRQRWRLNYWAGVYRYLNVPAEVECINAQLPVHEQVDWLEQVRPDYLLVNPRMALEICNEYHRRKSRPAYKLAGIRTFGETRSPLIDNHIYDTFGVKPLSMYTSEDLGHIAIECPGSGNYHVCDENVLVEVVGSCDQASGCNNPGRLLVTSLHGYAMPRIRYEVGDEACTLAACSCGRPQTLISEIAGRTGNLFQRPDGTKFRPERGLLARAADLLCARAVQIAQVGLNKVEVRYQPDIHNKSNTDKQACQREVQSSLGSKLLVEFVQVDRIPAKLNGKREDFVCELAPLRQ